MIRLNAIPTTGTATALATYPEGLFRASRTKAVRATRVYSALDAARDFSSMLKRLWKGPEEYDWYRGVEHRTGELGR